MSPKLIILAALVALAAVGSVASGQSPSVARNQATSKIQAGSESTPPSGHAPVRMLPNVGAAGAFGRYQLNAAGDRLLDTVTGTLYAVRGDSWQAVVRLSEPDRIEEDNANAALRTQIRALQKQMADHAAQLQVHRSRRPVRYGADCRVPLMALGWTLATSAGFAERSMTCSERADHRQRVSSVDGPKKLASWPRVQAICRGSAGLAAAVFVRQQVGQAIQLPAQRDKRHCGGHCKGDRENGRKQEEARKDQVGPGDPLLRQVNGHTPANIAKRECRRRRKPALAVQPEKGPHCLVRLDGLPDAYFPVERCTGFFAVASNSLINPITRDLDLGSRPRFEKDYESSAQRRASAVQRHSACRLQLPQPVPS